MENMKYLLVTVTVTVVNQKGPEPTLETQLWVSLGGSF